METKFFTYVQNNSGGYYVENDETGVCPAIIIEAEDVWESWDKLKEIGDRTVGFWSFCPCCGKRWEEISIIDDDGTEEPELFGHKIADTVDNWSVSLKRAFVHYKNGDVVEFKLKSKEDLDI